MIFGKPIQPIQPKKAIGPFKNYQFRPPKASKGINIYNFTQDIYKVKMKDLKNLNLKNLSFALDKVRKNIKTNISNKVNNLINYNLNYYTTQEIIQRQPKQIPAQNILSLNEILGFINKDILNTDKNLKLIYDSFITNFIKGYDKEILSPNIDYLLLFSFIKDYFRYFKIGFDENTDEEYNNVVNNVKNFLIDKVKYSVEKILNEDFLSDDYYTTAPLNETLYQVSNIEQMINAIQNNILIGQQSNNEYRKNNKSAETIKFLTDNILSFIMGKTAPILSFVVKFGSILYSLFSKDDKYNLQTLNLRGKGGKIKKFNELTRDEKDALEYFADNLDVDKKELYESIVYYQKILNVYRLYSRFIFIDTIDKSF